MIEIDKYINQVINDDCVEVLSNLPESSIDLIITDPPYGVDFEDELYDDSSSLVFQNYETWLKNMSRVLKEHSHLYLFIPTLQIDKWLGAVRNYFKFNNILAAQVYQTNKSSNIKNNFTFDLQLIIFASKNSPKKFNNVNWIPTSASWLRDKRNKNTQPYTYQYPSFINPKIIRANTKPNDIIKRIHPNEKNPKLIQYWIEMSTNPKEIVLDPFCGSGSTGVAAWLANRNFLLIEKNQEYFQRAKDRINSLIMQKKITDF